MISKEPPPADRNCMTGEVWDIGYLGNLSLYHVKLDSGKMVTATQANMARLVQRPITWDERIDLTWAPGAEVILLNMGMNAPHAGPSSSCRPSRLRPQCPRTLPP